MLASTQLRDIRTCLWTKLQLYMTPQYRACGSFTWFCSANMVYLEHLTCKWLTSPNYLRLRLVSKSSLGSSVDRPCWWCCTHSSKRPHTWRYYSCKHLAGRRSMALRSENPRPRQQVR
eukprot:5344218-Amphidinium_carterae.1